MSAYHPKMPIEAYPKIHELLCTLIKSSQLDLLLESQSWKRDGTFLAIKLAQHLHSAKRLADATKLGYQDLPITFVDFSSVHILVRAAVETFILYAYIYGGDDESLSIFRHNTWEFGGMAYRQKLIPGDQEAHHQLMQEKQRMDELEKTIRSSPHLPSIGKNINSLFNKGEWRTDRGWPRLGCEAGLHARWIEHVYNHLSGHAHTSYVSILQLAQAQPTMEDQQWLADVSLSIGLEVMAHFADLYASKQPGAKQYLSEHIEAHNLLKFWKFTADDYENMYKARTSPI